jgi:hypothetical protein
MVQDKFSLLMNYSGSISQSGNWQVWVKNNISISVTKFTFYEKIGFIFVTTFTKIIEP